MRFIVMHRTNAHWESGAIPDAGLIARVGTLIGAMAKAGILQGAEGLRPSSEGARLTSAGGTRTVTYGPFEGSHELPAGFSIVRARSLEEADGWAREYIRTVGAEGVDLRELE